MKMGNITISGILAGILFVVFITFSFCSSASASPLAEESSNINALINEVRLLRDDLQRYSTVSYKAQAYSGRLQVQLLKLSSARDALAAIGAEIENLNAQNSADGDELEKLSEQTSPEMVDKAELGMQVKGLKQSMADREKLIADMRAKEVLKEAEYKEEQKKLEAISTDINQLELELKRRQP